MGILGGVLGLAAGSLAGGAIAAAAVTLFIPAPDPGDPHNPIAIASALGDAAVRAFWVISGGVSGGVIGAIGGATFGATRAIRRSRCGPPPTTDSARDDEVAKLKARIAELERDGDGSL
jgi:hypothetical protein